MYDATASGTAVPALALLSTCTRCCVPLCTTRFRDYVDGLVELHDAAVSGTAVPTPPYPHCLQTLPGTGVELLDTTVSVPFPVIGFDSTVPRFLVRQYIPLQCCCGRATWSYSSYITCCCCCLAGLLLALPTCCRCCISSLTSACCDRALNGLGKIIFSTANNYEVMRDGWSNFDRYVGEIFLS